MRSLILVVCVMMTSLSCSDSNKEMNVPMNKEDLTKELQLLQGKRIYFGHQSVGQNVIEGLQDILAEHPGMRLNIVHLSDSAALPNAFFAESPIGANGYPEQKCADFVKIVDSTFAGKLDVALMKFCFADIVKTTDVNAIFSAYRKAVEDVRKTYPQVKIVHITVPLTSGTVGWRRIVNSVLGRTGNSDFANMQRARFNEMLRQQYAGEPIFDLARMESTYPDGRQKTFDYEGAKYGEMVPEYADPGGAHLNEVGRKIAARELVKTLAAAAGV